MPFEELETETKANMPPMASLSYLTGKRKDSKNKGIMKPKLIVSLPTSIVISKCEKFVIQIGTGQDFGKLRIVGLQKGVPGKGVSPTDFKAHIMLRFGHVPCFGDEIWDGVQVPIVRVDDDIYDLTVPREILPQEVQSLKRA
jgi:hypothetical protein